MSCGPSFALPHETKVIWKFGMEIMHTISYRLLCTLVPMDDFKNNQFHQNSCWCLGDIVSLTILLEVICWLYDPLKSNNWSNQICMPTIVLLFYWYISFASAISQKSFITVICTWYKVNIVIQCTQARHYIDTGLYIFFLICLLISSRTMFWDSFWTPRQTVQLIQCTTK